MLKIGVTGGIGAGKSIVSTMLTAMGFSVFNSDAEAKKIVNENELVRSALIDLAGNDIYIDGILDRKILADIIFKHPEIRERVNNIIHPAVRESFALFAEKSRQPIVFNEAAILFETGAYLNFDKTILIVAPKELKIQRVMNRDRSKKQEVLDRMNAQWEDDEKIKLADFVVVNDEVTPLLAQVEQIVDQLISS